LYLLGSEIEQGVSKVPLGMPNEHASGGTGTGTVDTRPFNAGVNKSCSLCPLGQKGKGEGGGTIAKYWTRENQNLIIQYKVKALTGWPKTGLGVSDFPRIISLIRKRGTRGNPRHT